MSDCLSGLIGLSNIDCDCIDPAPVGSDESISGLFLTDEVALKPIVFSSAECWNGSTVWETLQDAHDHAVTRFCIDLKAQLYGKYDNKYNVYSGFIGDNKGSSNSQEGPFYGQRWKPQGTKGGCYTLRGFEIATTDSENDVTINVYRSDYPDDILASITVNTVANTWTEVVLPAEVELSLYDEYCDDFEYIFEYELADGNYPLRNKFTCCGKVPAWKKYAQVKGFYSPDQDTYQTNGSYSYGLRIDGFFNCKSLEWLCEIKDVDGYGLRDVIATAIQYKGTVKLIDKILHFPDPHFYTVSNREQLINDRIRFIQGYNTNVSFISDNIPLKMLDCFRCKTGSGKMRKSFIGV